GKSPIQRQTDESAHDSGDRAGAALGKTQTVSPIDEVVLGDGLRGPLSAVVAHTFHGIGSSARPDHGSVRRCSIPPPNSCPAPRSPTPPRGSSTAPQWLRTCRHADGLFLLLRPGVRRQTSTLIPLI